MKVTCPACGSAFDLDAAVSDADARRFVDLVAGLDPRVAKPLIQYLALFRPAKTGMRWSRMLALAQEIEPMIREARIRRNGIAYAVPLDAWAAALSMLADRPKNLTLPLKTHGYLLEILANQAEKTAAKIETEAETRKRTALAREPKLGELEAELHRKRTARSVERSTPAAVSEHLASLRDAVEKKP